MYFMFGKLQMAVIFGALLVALSIAFSGNAFAAGTGLATKSAGSNIGASSDNKLLQYTRGGRRGGGGGGGRANRGGGGGGQVNRSGGNRNQNVNRNQNTNRNVNRNTNVNRNVNRNVNVNVRHRGYGWRGARWGAVAFGVVMGTAIIVAANTPPPAPDPSLCWTWSNSALTQGYWYYCDGP